MNAGCEGEISQDFLRGLDWPLFVERVGGGGAEALWEVGLVTEVTLTCTEDWAVKSGQKFTEIFDKHRLSMQAHVCGLEEVAESEKFDADVHHVVPIGEGLIVQIDACCKL